jgi:hypothetical protein
MMSRKLAIFGTALVFLMVVVFYKIPLSTDDWHWAQMLKEGHKLPILDTYFFRLPVWRLGLNIFFPLLLKFPALGRLIFWGSGIIGAYLFFLWFF